MKEIFTDAKDIVVSVEKLLVEITKFVQKNIVKIDVKFKEGPMLKKARMELANGLRNLAKLVEDPKQKIVWVDIKKGKPAEKK